MAETKSQWHALTCCNGRHRRPKVEFYANRMTLLEWSVLGSFGKEAMKLATGGLGGDIKPVMSWGTEYDITPSINGVLEKMAGQIGASS